jgi:Protein of unknown function (DUF3606)
MRRAKSQPVRNKLDLSDRVQVRLVKKRLRLSDAQLAEIVGKSGNSIAAISKEVALQRTNRLPDSGDVIPAAVIASAAVAEPNATELDQSQPVAAFSHDG